MDRRALVARARRRAFVPVVAATAVLCVAWVLVDPTNCAPTRPENDYCLWFGHQRVLLLTAVAGPVGAAALALAAVVPDSWTARLPDAGVLQRPPGTLLVVVAVTAAYAPFLFRGVLVSSPWLWVLLAVPFAPYLATLSVTYALSRTIPDPGLPVVLLFLFVMVLAQAVWYVGLAVAVDRATVHVRNVVASQTNST